jgi:hypothetical protein
MKWFKKKGQTRRSNIISIKNLKGNTDTNRRIATCLETDDVSDFSKSLLERYATRGDK